MRESIWSKTVGIPSFDSLKGEIKTDVLIIGGGLCGILCAYFLKKSGVNCVLVEGSKIASGITKNTTAKITSQHGLIYNKLINDFDKDTARLYLAANENAIKRYAELCENIDCDFERKSAYTYSLSSRAKIEDEVKAVNSLGFAAEFKKDTELPFEVRGAIQFPNQAQFNPLKFIAEASKDLNIFENTFIRDITPTTAVSDNGKIKANKIIIATHFPFINKHGSYFLKLYQERSYVSAFKNTQTLDGMYRDEDVTGLSFRCCKDILLIGCGSHRTGKPSSAWSENHNFARAHYPGSELVCEWATQDCMSLDSIPYIGKYSSKTKNLYVASGFNKWGMTASMVAAEILCDLVTDKENEFAKIFTPERSILKPQLILNSFETVKNLLTPTLKRCPHLGCALKWNKHEHTWDCPCHGSRFTEEGRLIDNPATGELRQQE